MEKLVTLEEALKRIEELEEENAKLREELEYYRNRKMSGRQKHNAKWMAIYNDFVAGYESGMTMVEIAKRNNVSERTIYRYKAYYDQMKTVDEKKMINWDNRVIMDWAYCCRKKISHDIKVIIQQRLFKFGWEIGMWYNF